LWSSIFCFFSTSLVSPTHFRNNMERLCLER
jgi:hypothetical protein